MLQVGKKYHYRYSRDVVQRTTYECIFADEHGALLRWPSRFSDTGTTTAWLDNKALTQYEEYRAVVHERIVNIWKTDSGEIIWSGPFMKENTQEVGRKYKDRTLVAVLPMKYVDNK